MGIATPNRLADPAHLESYTPPCKMIQEGGLFVPYFNSSTTLTLIAGEPVVFGDRVGIVQRSILPQKMGTIVFDWIVEALVDPARTGNILQGALVYWDTSKDAVVAIETGGSAVAGVGAAVSSAPTNGFILGRAVSEYYRDVPSSLIASNQLVCAKTGSTVIRVVSLAGATTTYSA